MTIFSDTTARLAQSRVLRFGLVGAAGYLVSVAALWLAHHLLALNYYASYVPAFLVAVTFTWWGNRLLTFHEHAARENLFVEWAKFVAANLLGFLVNYALYTMMLRFAPAPLDNPFIAQIAGTLFGMIFNFTLSKRFVFQATRLDKKTLQIKNARGEVVFTFAGANSLDFDSADLRGVNLKGGILEGARFSDANLSGACLEDCDLYWAIFFRANLSRANLRSAQLLGCDFKEANLEGADLSGADLGRDNLGGASQLEGTNLANCKVDGTNFEGASYDKQTVLPAGFEPQKHNMRFIET